jgi:hypothetical protein
MIDKFLKSSLLLLYLLCEDRLVNCMVRIVLKSMNRGEYDERWVIRPIPKDTQNEGRNTPVPLLLYCLRLVSHSSNFDLISVEDATLLLD